MRLPFCDHHISAFLHSFETGPKPLDQALADYLRSHKSIGANDRRSISETLYGMVRWQSLIDYFCKSSLPADRLAAYRKLSIDDCFDDPSIPAPVRFAVPSFLYIRFLEEFGPEKTASLCKILNGRAPTVIRANLIKTTQAALLQKLGEKFSATPCLYA